MVKERHTHTYTCSKTTASTNQQGTAHYLCHRNTNTYSLFWNPCPLIPTQTYFHTHICTHRCTHNPFIACAPSLCFFPAMFVCIVWVCVCLQVRSLHSETLHQRDWNQYFLLRHLSHLYKAEAIWTPVYSTLVPFIKLPHVAKMNTHIHTQIYTTTYWGQTDAACTCSLHYCLNFCTIIKDMTNWCVDHHFVIEMFMNNIK